MNTPEILSAADLIPGDVLLPTREEVTGYPYGGPSSMTMLPVALNSGVEITRLVEPERQYEVVRP